MSSAMDTRSYAIWAGASAFLTLLTQSANELLLHATPGFPPAATQFPMVRCAL